MYSCYLHTSFIVLSLLYVFKGGKVGLCNLGATCYVNTLLQVLEEYNFGHQHVTTTPFHILYRALFTSQ